MLFQVFQSNTDNFYVYTKFLHRKQDVTQSQIFKQNSAGLNFVFLLLGLLPNQD